MGMVDKKTICEVAPAPNSFEWTSDMSDVSDMASEDSIFGGAWTIDSTEKMNSQFTSMEEIKARQERLFGKSKAPASPASPFVMDETTENPRGEEMAPTVVSM